MADEMETSNGQASQKPRLRQKQRSKARKGEQSSADTHTPVASTSQASYVPPAAGVQQYARGKPVPTRARNKKLATHLSTLANQQKASASAAYEHDALLLPHDSGGRLEAEGDLERTWKVSQREIRESVGASAAQKSFQLRLEDTGPYALDYTADGRHLAIAGRKGHTATFDWQTGKPGTELHLNETVRDVAWLHNTSFFAAAQKKYVYIYDSNGLEIHQLRNHIEVTQMQFLRYHFLLATVGNAGYLKYQDTSTGALVAEHRTRLGACSVMAQNPHSAVISLGHSNGTTSMWTPNMPTAHVKLLAHQGPLTAIAHDPSSMGRNFATAGMDGAMKVWDARMWATVNEWKLPKPAASLAYSQKGLLAAGWGGHTTIYADSTRVAARAPGPYMTELFPSTSVHAVAFCPFEDVLGVGHSRGFSSLVIPGAGEANFDSLEADPFASKRSRREREVVSLLDKLQPDQITMDADFIGRLAPSKAVADITATPGAKNTARGKDFRELSRLDRLHATDGIEDGSDGEKEDTATAPKAGTDETGPRKVRGRSKVLKRILRRKKNVIDEKTLRTRELIEERRKAAVERRKQDAKRAQTKSEATGALGRFA